MVVTTPMTKPSISLGCAPIFYGIQEQLKQMPMKNQPLAVSGFIKVNRPQ